MGNILITPLIRMYDGFLDFGINGWTSWDVKGPPIGLIILGNTGVGKSLLANILLNEDFFRHGCSPSSVTHETEWKQFRASKRNYVVFNIPGLIENNQEAIERNKKEIQRAFENTPYAIVVPVFSGGSSGRLREEDLVAFNALNAAYKFEQESLLFVINDLPLKRPPFFEGQTYVRLEELVKMKNLKICFLNRINTNSYLEKRKLRQQMLEGIAHCTPTKHKKHAEITLLVNQLEKLKNDMEKLQKELDRKIGLLDILVEKLQQQYDKTKESKLCIIS